jgi:ParB family chromosome partitioning protein
MSKQRGLGRGLGAFFPGAAAAPATHAAADDAASGGQRVAMLAIDSIAPNPNQPRRAFDAAELEALSQSIRANGVLSPILVRSKARDTYEIVAGERRWRATRLAGLAEIPALVRDVDDPHALEIALVENLQRTDLNPIEEAAGYRQLIDDHGFTHDTLSQRLGKARPTLANALRLLSLPDSVQAMVRDRGLSAGHARALAALSPQRAEELARAAVDRGLSVRDVERLASAVTPARRKQTLPRTARPAIELPPDLAEIETRLRFALATRVAIHPAAAGGSIEIRYAGDEELQRIVDTICPEES